jgi:hypothetical protein
VGGLADWPVMKGCMAMDARCRDKLTSSWLSSPIFSETKERGAAVLKRMCVGVSNKTDHS